MRIGLDLMGGDFTPEASLEGVKIAMENLSINNKLYLLGDISLIKSQFNSIYNHLSSYSNIQFVDSPQIVEMDESPTKTFINKPQSSISIGFKMLEKNEIDAFASAGNTGAMMVGAFYSAKPIEGVIRPAISTLIPKLNGGKTILLDVGVNPDCRQDVLFQFGLLGCALSKSMFKVENPRVGLLNIGSEKEKGNLLTQAAYSLMEATNKFNFIGNIEGYDLFSDKVDIIVCDGFTGNVTLKLIEGMYQIIKKTGNTNSFIDLLNFELYGGTPVLGINKTVLVGHGNSTPIAFKNIINLAINVFENKLTEEIKEVFKSINNF